MKNFFRKRTALGLLIAISMSSAIYANDDVERFKESWIGRTLELQNQMDINVPLNQATIVGTHNSYNASDYQIPFVRYLDPNQIFPIYDQLELGARSIELDAHWTLGKHFKKEILLCHGQNNHVGCSPFDRPFSDGLEELQSWLKNNPNEVVLLYIERHLDDHDSELASQLNEYLDTFIFKPSMLKTTSTDHKTCVSLPADTLTKADVLKSGKQLIIVTKGCDTSSIGQDYNLNNYVFSGMGNIQNNSFSFLDSTYDNTVTPYPTCSSASIFIDDAAHATMWRIYDDLARLSSLEKPTHKISADEMRGLVQCNINWLGMDKIDINDERLSAMIWSWAQDYPKAGQGQCAILKLDSGIQNIPCMQNINSFACKNTHNEWQVVNAVGQWNNGEKFCQSIAGQEWHFATPINGKEMYLLKQAAAHQAASETALNYQADAKQHWLTNSQNTSF